MITAWRRVAEVDLLAIWQNIHAASAPAIFLCFYGHYCDGDGSEFQGGFGLLLFV